MRYFFFFQAEDGIRDHCVTGVQTCALPISRRAAERRRPVDRRHPAGTLGTGRVTPKGTTPAGRRPSSSSRYTPPVPREQKVSPRWVPVLMFALLGLGAAM